MRRRPPRCDARRGRWDRRCGLTLADGGPAPIDTAWEIVVADVERTERALSRFRSGSDLSQLNLAAGDGAWHGVGDRLHTCLAASRRAWRLTGGRFDPRVIARLEKLGEHGDVQLPAPQPAHVRTWVDLDPRGRRARLWAPVDSGGIGKGLALRWAARSLALGGVHRFMLEAGGDLIVQGEAPEGGQWHIGIEDPAGSVDPIAVIGLDGGAAVTSSIAVRRWIGPEGSIVHHLIDPATGEATAMALASVTVAAPDPAWAEVWSKALFLAGRRGIGPEARARGIAAWWVESDGTCGMTPAARSLTLWARADRPR